MASTPSKNLRRREREQRKADKRRARKEAKAEKLAAEKAAAEVGDNSCQYSSMKSADFKNFGKMVEPRRIELLTS